ncbi:amidohydrolase family protein, partial [Rhizobiaceae sp. 2RAB30]
AMDRIRAAAARARPGGWLIVAGGWTEQQFAERRRPTAAELQEAAPNHPVYVQLFYEAVAMTPKALEALGVPAGTLPAG